jgi:hypothetical protein
MAPVIITEESDPILWTSLYNQYVAQGQSRNVTAGTDLYEVVQTTSETYEFILVETLDYIDSRSIKGSRSATYTNLAE